MPLWTPMAGSAQSARICCDTQHRHQCTAYACSAAAADATSTIPLANVPRVPLRLDCKILPAGENIIVIVGGANTSEWDFSQETQQARSFCMSVVACAVTIQSIERLGCPGYRAGTGVGLIYCISPSKTDPCHASVAALCCGYWSSLSSERHRAS